jgi:hypothetical protein
MLVARPVIVPICRANGQVKAAISQWSARDGFVDVCRESYALTTTFMQNTPAVPSHLCLPSVIVTVSPAWHFFLSFLPFAGASSLGYAFACLSLCSGNAFRCLSSRCPCRTTLTRASLSAKLSRLPCVFVDTPTLLPAGETYNRLWSNNISEPIPSLC